MSSSNSMQPQMGSYNSQNQMPIRQPQYGGYGGGDKGSPQGQGMSMGGGDMQQGKGAPAQGMQGGGMQQGKGASPYALNANPGHSMSQNPYMANPVNNRNVGSFAGWRPADMGMGGGGAMSQSSPAQMLSPMNPYGNTNPYTPGGVTDQVNAMHQTPGGNRILMRN